ncbi:hypothetical protein [Vineibacter terrae]|uniref:hypothetical protein n=1 Tax=Vineibacter terrae TaxID=2586908 RepID=UPI002E332C00|nr:hypothetical protein [Vineibacter terrae]HEX2889293.1 hypothetical protein [Vineibacter terrae]
MTRGTRRAGGARRSAATEPPILQALRNALVREVQRQYDAGAQPGHLADLDGFMVPADEDNHDIFAVFDTELRITPIIVAVLKELRKLEDGEIPDVIDGVLKAAPVD